MSGWGVNGSLVTLLPDQLVQLASPPPAPASASSGSSSGLLAGAVAGIVVGSCVGAALLVWVGVLLLRTRCVMLLCATAAYYMHVAAVHGGGRGSMPLPARCADLPCHPCPALPCTTLPHRTAPQLTAAHTCTECPASQNPASTVSDPDPYPDPDTLCLNPVPNPKNPCALCNVNRTTPNQSSTTPTNHQLPQPTTNYPNQSSTTPTNNQLPQPITNYPKKPPTTPTNNQLPQQTTNYPNQ